MWMWVWVCGCGCLCVGEWVGVVTKQYLNMNSLLELVIYVKLMYCGYRQCVY